MAVQKLEPPVDLTRVMQADQFRLRRSWERIQADRISEIAIEQWRKKAEKSAELLAQRIASVPDLTYDEDLPITSHRSELIDLIKARQVIVVCGETGSGKSTQLPKLCLEAGLGVRGMIGHTQPRRLAARAVSNRLADELETQVGELVGYKIRFTDSTRSSTLIKLMTDGVLLAETQSDRFLDQYDAIIIDEAHERSLNIDFLIGYLRQLSCRRPDLRVIVTSATIDPERFANHFSDESGPAPIVEVSGRTYPVETRYRPSPDPDANLDDDTYLREIADSADELMAEGPGDILVFLPTERDIRITAKYLRGHLTQAGREKSVEILPLYARLSQVEQNKIFAGHTKRRIVLSTNVAESSLTVPGIHYVIDSGLVRISRYAPRSRVQRLPIEDVSQASANQRAGRCGRLGPGICIRLFDEQEFERRPQFTTPEIRRSDLASVLLQSMVLRLGPLDQFPLLDPPTPESLRDGRRTLEELGAVDDDGKLTKIGRQLGSLPTAPRVGRMLIEAEQRKCLSDMIIIAAALECQDVRQRPAGARPQADEAHVQFQDPHSDFLSYLRLFRFYEKLRSDLGRSRLQKALGQRFLSYQGYREWSNTVRQLKELARSAGLRADSKSIDLPKVDPALIEQSQGDRRVKGSSQAAAKLKRPDGYDVIHQALLAGLLSGVAQKGDRHEYKATRGLSISLWPGSGLFRRQPKWVVTAEIVETNRRYGRTLAEIDVEWIEKAAGPLLKHSYSDPHWSRKSGSAMVYRRSSLYGLSIVAGRRVALAPIDAETARTLMIEHGLVAGEWDCREKFYMHNQEMLADMHELVQRTRSRDYILDRYHLANFYSRRVPDQVYDLPSLRAWIRKNSSSDTVQSMFMRPEDLVKHDPQITDVGEHFPNTIQVGNTSLPLDYHFEPGHPQDGVAVTIPKAALRQVSEESLGWLVPGLLEEKVLYLIRSLPKSLRTNFVPAPDVARKIAGELQTVSRETPFTTALCTVLNNHSEEPVRAKDFETEKLPPHLKMMVRLVDDEGTVIDESRAIKELQQQHAVSATQIPSDETQTSEWKNQTITPQSFDCCFDHVSIRRGGVIVAAYPALIDQGDKVELRLVDTAAEAENANLTGLTRLFAMKHHKSLRTQVAHLPNLEACSMQLGHLINGKDLRQQLQDLVARIALVEDQPPVLDAETFDARNARASVQISIAAQEVATWLPKLADGVHDLRLRNEKAPAAWSEVFHGIAQQQRHFFPEGFLQTIPWRALAEYPRYLRAMSMRLDKLSSGGIPKDRRLREPLERAWQQYEALAQKYPAGGAPSKLNQLRWLIEEYRVSIFAQKLGTKEKVSEKRINELVDSLSQ